ncbi:MAG: MBL fold metallo-hydrolase [Verrucomicrobiota bacterium]
MFNVTILGSGSAGNCALVESSGCRLLIDGGLSARQMTTRLSTLGVDPCTIDGILLTHEHSDHVSGMRVFCKKTPIPVYCTRLTAEILRKEELALHQDVRQFQTGTDFEIRDIMVHAFSVPHDAVDPVGFVLRHSDGSLGFLTDLGKCTHLARERVRGVNTLVIETNYDEKLLQNDTRRPWAIKQRIMSSHGHLSNTAAASEVEEMLAHGLNRAILCHLSRDCNTPTLAVDTVRARVTAAGAGETVEVYCSSQTEVSPRFAVGP